MGYLSHIGAPPVLCPIDFRYGRAGMKDLFSEEAKLQRLLAVEAALTRAHAQVGNIPRKDAEAIAAQANTRAVRLSRVREIEARISHDVMAMVTALTEQVGEAGRYVHLGATSNDITDTATALQIRDGLDIVGGDLRDLQGVLLDLAEKYQSTMMLGRTHGQAAVPMTFGLKMAVYALEVHRHLERLPGVRERSAVGKMSGAVGTGAALGPKALEIQRITMEELGLRAEEASSQIVGRDRYVELVSYLANVATSCEKFATEVRNLQRTEIGEAAEAFDAEHQVGSSTMAQKENPITSENIVGLARVVRGFLIPTFENVPLWHERDLTNSASERFILPHVFVLGDDILAKTAEVFRTLRVRPERMAANLEATQGQAMAEAVITALVARGMGRQEAHELLRRASLQAREGGKHLKEVLAQTPEVKKYLKGSDLDRAMDPQGYLGQSREIVQKVRAICAGK